MRACALTIFMLVAAVPAMAERADREKEIVGVADRSVVDDAKKVLTLEGNVVVTQGTMRITSSRVTVQEDAQKNKLYIASGAPVTFRQKRDNVDEWVDGQAQRAEFDEKNDVIKLFERARVKSGANELTGDFISYDMKREVAEVAGAPPGKTPPANAGRVKVIILPPKRAPEAEDRKPAPAPALNLKSDPGKS